MSTDIQHYQDEEELLIKEIEILKKEVIEECKLRNRLLPHYIRERIEKIEKLEEELKNIIVEEDQ